MVVASDFNMGRTADEIHMTNVFLNKILKQMELTNLILSEMVSEVMVLKTERGKDYLKYNFVNLKDDGEVLSKLNRSTIK